MWFDLTRTDGNQTLSERVTVGGYKCQLPRVGGINLCCVFRRNHLRQSLLYKRLSHPKGVCDGWLSNAVSILV